MVGNQPFWTAQWNNEFTRMAAAAAVAFLNLFIVVQVQHDTLSRSCLLLNRTRAPLCSQ